VVVPFVVSAQAQVECTGTGVLRPFSLNVDATSRGGRFATATLHWSTSSTSTQERPMAVSGTTAQVKIENLVGSAVVWWVEGTASGGRRDRSNAVTLENPC
jgi:hypothetical protein